MKEPKTNTVEAVFHRAIKQHLNKRQQGLVMGHFREAMVSVQSTALPEKHSCGCVDVCAQGDLATDEVTSDCRRSA